MLKAAPHDSALTFLDPEIVLAKLDANMQSEIREQEKAKSERESQKAAEESHNNSKERMRIWNGEREAWSTTHLRKHTLAGESEICGMLSFALPITTNPDSLVLIYQPPGQSPLPLGHFRLLHDTLATRP